MKMLKKALAITAAAATLAAFALTASAESYKGYIMFQNGAYSFRNPFNDAKYGEATDYFNNVVVWGGNDPEEYPDYADNFDYDIEGYVIPATYTDVTIDGDGTYTVAIDDFDWALDGVSSFNLLGVPTTIPLEAGATITDASIIVDGTVTSTIAAPMQNPDEKTNMYLLFANIWNTDLESYQGAYPTKSLAIQFTVIGLGAAATDAPAADDTAADDTAAPAPTTDKTSPDTGVEGVAAFAGIAVLAGAAVVISRKRK